MIEIVLGLVIVFLFLFGCRNLIYEPEGLASMCMWIPKRFLGVIEIILSFFMAQFSIINYGYWIIEIIILFFVFPIYLREIFQPFIDFNSIYRYMTVLPEQKLNYDIFKQIFVIDPKSFALANHNLFYVDENKKYRKFYMSRIDLYRALKLIDEYQTKGINSNATPITDDMLKKIKREHEKGEKLQAEAIEGLTKASENWKI